MVFSDVLVAQLNALSAAPDEPGANLNTILEDLLDDLSAVVSSFLGLTMTLSQDGMPITLTAIDNEIAITAGASVELQLPPRSGADIGPTVVFFAGNKGAFVDLAADAERVCGPDGRVVLDGQLLGRAINAPSPGVTGLADLDVVNRAIGVLISRGFSVAEAHCELRRRAAGGPHGLPAAATQVLTSTNARGRRQ
jgi:hypothetical protein